MPRFLYCLIMVALPIASNAGVLDSPQNGMDSLLASTYFGGSSNDGLYEVPMARDSDGNVYVASRTNSSDLPTTVGAYAETKGNGFDVFIAKFTGDLTTLLAATFLGGSGNDGEWPGVALTLDEDGNVYVAGLTSSGNFPTTAGAYDLGYSGGMDVFISKLNPDLTTLLASTYLGGTGEEGYTQMVLGPTGQVYVTGVTASSNFPTTEGAYDRTYNAGGGRGYEVFVSQLDADLTTLLASTFLGGSGDDIPEAIVRDDIGNVYLTGWTSSSNLPTTEGAYDRSYNGYYWDAFVSKLTSDLSTLSASTFLGGGSWEFGYCLALDENANVYVTGHFASSNFPTTPGAYDETYNGAGGADIGDDCYVAKFDSGLSSLLASTYLGGSYWENATGIAVGGDGYVYVAGVSASSDFPISTCTFDSTYNGGVKYNGDIFITRFDSDLEELSFSTYFGGSSHDNLGSITFDPTGNLFLSGNTASPDFPITVGAYDTSYNEGSFTWGGDIILSVIPHGYWTDLDDDGHIDLCDNCPSQANPGQEDTDLDGTGDVCDACEDFDDFADADADSVPDGCDQCTDTDGDGYGDPAYFANTCVEDNCPDTFNPDQADSDSDGIGDACCCVGQTGNVDGDPEDQVDLGDLTRLIDYLFISFAPPSCMTEANTDGDAEGSVDLSDLTALINFLFISFTQPAACL